MNIKAYIRMKIYSEEELKKYYPIGSYWETSYGPMYVVGYDGDMDSIGYLVTFKEQGNFDTISLHPFFIRQKTKS